MQSDRQGTLQAAKYQRRQAEGRENVMHGRHAYNMYMYVR